MNTATEGDKRTGNAGLIVHLAHIKLLVAVLAGAAWLGVTHVDRAPLAFADVGTMGARASLPAPPTPKIMPAARSASALSAEMKRVRDYVASQYRVSTKVLDPVLAAAEHRGRSAGVDPLLIVAVMAIESSFDPQAVSSMGAQGLMQVIPRFHKDKIGDDGGEDALFDPLLNVRVGTEVLVEGLRRFGSVQTALQYYGGALRDPNAAYANKVLAMKKRLVTAAGRGTGTDA